MEVAVMRMDANKTKTRLSRMERQRQLLDRQIQLLHRKTLTEMPKQAGFDSVDSLISALLEYASPALRARFKAAGLFQAPSGNGASHEHHHNGARAKFSPEVRELIRKELLAGMKSVAEISREYGPSHPTIMGWKREWGMTKPKPKRSS
jgi:hypothetical protein